MGSDLGRRKALAAIAAATAGGVMMGSGSAEASSEGSGGGGIPRGFEDVDPRTARRVPLWQTLAPSNPIFPGDPRFTYEIWTTIPESGYLLEHITSLGTHTGTHISAPAHFVPGAKYLNELDERWTLMPLTVIDVRSRVTNQGGDFFVDLARVKAFEQRHGRYPYNGCVLLLTGFGNKFDQGQAYFDPAPGFTGEPVAWLFEQRGTFAVGADTFGPDATSDDDFSATSPALLRLPAGRHRLHGVTGSASAASTRAVAAQRITSASRSASRARMSRSTTMSSKPSTMAKAETSRSNRCSPNWCRAGSSACSIHWMRR